MLLTTYYLLLRATHDEVRVKTIQKLNMKLTSEERLISRAQAAWTLPWWSRLGFKITTSFIFIGSFESTTWTKNGKRFSRNAKKFNCSASSARLAMLPLQWKNTVWPSRISMLRLQATSVNPGKILKKKSRVRETREGRRANLGEWETCEGRGGGSWGVGERRNTEERRLPIVERGYKGDREHLRDQMCGIITCLCFQGFVNFIVGHAEHSKLGAISIGREFRKHDKFGHVRNWI